MKELLLGKLGWSSQENGDRDAHCVINSFHSWTMSLFIVGRLKTGLDILNFENSKI